jgi:hypothetical protein
LFGFFLGFLQILARKIAVEVEVFEERTVKSWVVLALLMADKVPAKATRFERSYCLLEEIVSTRGRGKRRRSLVHPGSFGFGVETIEIAVHIASLEKERGLGLGEIGSIRCSAIAVIREDGLFVESSGVLGIEVLGEDRLVPLGAVVGGA